MVAATAPATRRDRVVICHPGALVTASAHGLSHPSHGPGAEITSRWLRAGITSPRLRCVVVNVHVHGACVPYACRREARARSHGRSLSLTTRGMPPLPPHT